MLVTLKPHSTLQHYFIGEDISINIDSYNDLLDYLIVMQPEFIHYTKQLVAEQLQESFVFLDENLTEIQRDDFFIKRFKHDTTIYIVPVVMGGGGKRGGVLAILAAAALFFVAAPLAGALAPTLSSVTGAKVTAAAVKTSITQMAVGLAISGLSAVMMKTPTAAKDSDSARLENNMFSSLQNTINSGTFVPINYGMPRVAGQMISGYIKTINHAKGFKISVRDVVGFDSSLYDPNEAAQSGFTTTPSNVAGLAQDGLLMYIDPGNPYSYTGSGTSVTDLITGQVGAFVGSVALDNFTFRFNGGYIDMGKQYIGPTEINDTDKQYTIEFWIKVPSSIISGTVLTNNALGVDYARSSDTITRYLGDRGAEVQETVYYATYSSINTTPALNNTTIMNTWTHIAYTLSGTTLKTYLNSGLINSTTVSTSITSPTNLLIGSAGLSGAYLGLARLYLKELSREEIRKNFNAEKARFEISANSAYIKNTTQGIEEYNHARDR